MIEAEKVNGEKPEESVLASMTIDNIRIDKIVREYFTAQSLKILPQAPFSDAVSQYVEKDDKHALEMFVNESLSGQVKQILELDDDDDDLDSIMERIREIQEEGFRSGAIKRAKRKAKYKPRPAIWDSDLDGEWEDQPGALIISDLEDGEDETPVPPARRGRVVVGDDDESITGLPAKKVPAKRAPAKKAPAKAPAKKAPTKAPAKGRKKATSALSDDEDDDLIMMDAEPAKPPPRRAAATRSTGRQTQLNFSQAGRSQARELSDDVISDDDDAFEPMTASSSRRR
jgi:double-strand break repair protein MRE11